MSAEVTPWFPASVKPVHVGVYEAFFAADNGGFIRRRQWTGSEWRLGFGPSFFGTLPGDQWRGLAHNPAETVADVLESARHQPVEV